MVIYANQSLRAAHNIMLKVLRETLEKESLDQVKIELPLKDGYVMKHSFKIS